MTTRRKRHATGVRKQKRRWIMQEEDRWLEARGRQSWVNASRKEEEEA
jgi:hypothetical protein